MSLIDLSVRVMSRRASIAAMVFALSGCVTVMNTVRPPVPRDLLRHRIDSLTSQPQFRNAHWGVLVVNPRTADTIYSRNAGKLFMPASNMKTITSAVARSEEHTSELQSQS